MELKVIKEFSDSDQTEIEKFLLENASKFDPLFSSPLWAERLRSLMGFRYEYLLVKEHGTIVAVHLIFYGFRGFTRINTLPEFLRPIARLYAKTFHSYIVWYNFIVTKNDLAEEVISDIKHHIYSYTCSQKLPILNSPINHGDEKDFRGKEFEDWGTYIIDINGQTYDEIYRTFKRPVRKSIQHLVEQDIVVRKLTDENIEAYVDWRDKNQKETGKFAKLDVNYYRNEFRHFAKNNYWCEVFIAYKDDIILGSLSIWGFGNFITEHGVNQSKYAKVNKLYVQDLIKDSIVRYMFENGILYYDLAGFNPSDSASEKEVAIRQFKKKFKGNEAIYRQVRG